MSQLPKFQHRTLRGLGALLLSGLVACTAVEPPHSEPETAGALISQSPWAKHFSDDGVAWNHKRLPNKQTNTYVYAHSHGRDSIEVWSKAAASLVKRPLHVDAARVGRLRFSWWVGALVESADLSDKDKDDAPVRVVLTFDGDRSKLSAKNLALSELAQMLTGEPMPYATLAYVWSNGHKEEDVIHNRRTDRIRQLVVRSGTAGLGKWQDLDRDIAADFQAAFGEPHGALTGVAIMTDTDNTGGQTHVWYGPIRFLDKVARH